MTNTYIGVDGQNTVLLSSQDFNVSSSISINSHWLASADSIFQASRNYITVSPSGKASLGKKWGNKSKFEDSTLKGNIRYLDIIFSTFNVY